MCHCCSDAREAPQHHRMFADYCLHCAARRIQYIQRVLQLGKDDKIKRCRTALQQALECGLPEKEIRAMAKQSAWQIQPEDAPPASSPAPRKRGR